jgi:hypothetical protein
MGSALRIAGTALVLGVLGGGLVGCGGSDGSDGGSGASASKDVSKDGFCEQVNSLYTKVLAGGIDNPADAIKGFKDWAAEMEDFGTPSELSDDAEEGLAVMISVIQGLPDDANVDDLQNFETNLSDADDQSAETFSTWVTDNCPDPELPTDLPSAD